VPTLRGLWAGMVRCCCWPSELRLSLM
jgi:hypothetical protein